MNKKNLELLNHFANSHSLSDQIQVIITDNYVSLKPRYDGSYAKYEDANLLSSIIQGAESFLYFLERNDYKIVAAKGKKK
jgi:hypothetical protein